MCVESLPLSLNTKGHKTDNTQYQLSAPFLQFKIIETAVDDRDECPMERPVVTLPALCTMVSGFAPCLIKHSALRLLLYNIGLTEINFLFLITSFCV